MPRLSALFAAAALSSALSLSAAAQAPAPPAPAAQGANDNAPHGRPEDPGRRGGDRPGPEGRRLPPDAVTQHVLDLGGGRTLRFTARAGSIPIDDAQGKLQSEIGYVAYTLDGAEEANRPVTFAVNGGPGASSAYLHIGALGPWRLPVDGSTISPSAPPALVPNGETWLEFTDLVFVDPVGTGYSRGAGSPDEIRNRSYSVEGDISELSSFVVRWLKARDRLASPKFFVGESYGGFRGPLMAEKLSGDYGVAFSGLVLLSPVLDFGAFNQQRWSPALHAGRLPSYAAAALEARNPKLSRSDLADAERYASGEYLVDLTRGVRDRDAVERITGRVAALTDADPALVRRSGGRIEPEAFQREFRRGSGRVASVYDTGVTAFDPDPTAHRERLEDPVLTALTAPLTSAIVDHLQRRLKYRVEGRYELLNGAVNGAWRWGSGRRLPEAVNELRQGLALDANLRVLVAHGFTDLVTPYFATKLILDQIPDYGDAGRLQLAVYPGGHMFYSRQDSRAAFRDDVRRLFETAEKARAEARPELAP